MGNLLLTTENGAKWSSRSVKNAQISRLKISFPRQIPIYAESISLRQEIATSLLIRNNLSKRYLEFSELFSKFNNFYYLVLKMSVAWQFSEFQELDYVE